jgi:hypothetical protein
MPYPHASRWFTLLFIIAVLGFWNSYFSRLTGDHHLAHHLHGISGILWLLILIVQPWLIKQGKRAPHRLLGRSTLFLVPVFVISGIWVTLYGQTNFEDPTSWFALGIFWFAFFSLAVFAAMYIQAIRYRKNMQLHARFMVATSLPFLLPGLARVVENYIAPLGIWIPSFYQLTWLPLLIGIWLMLLEMRKNRPWQPYLQSNIWWAVSAAAWFILPEMGFWRSFSLWAVEVFK